MAYLDYGSLIDDDVRQQYNIMALVGNGFDLQVLNKYKRVPATQYEDFYHFLQMKRVGTGNRIVEEMQDRRREGSTNWSDVEDCVAGLVTKANPQQLPRDLAEIQGEFSEFLNLVANTSVLSRLNDDAMRSEWARRSLSSFLYDLEDEADLDRIPFGKRQENHDLYNFYFINFNFTALLDNYIYLDQKQFDPRPHSTVRTNFEFDTNPRKMSAVRGWDYRSSSYVMAEVVHPHGYQDIPRSLLFGTGETEATNKTRARLSKTYWAQNDLKYQHLFDDTSLFIIFGCSLGDTDDWWWGKIADSLYADRERAAMLYWWSDEAEAVETDVLRRFFDAAKVHPGDEARLRRQICVVPFSSATDHVWLGMEEK